MATDKMLGFCLKAASCRAASPANGQRILPSQASLPGPDLNLATDSRIERQATARRQTPGIQGRLADHRRETVLRVEREFGITFGQPQTLLSGNLTRGYSLLFPNSASGAIEVVTPGRVTTYPMSPHRPLPIGVSPDPYPIGHVIRFCAEEGNRRLCIRVGLA